MKFIITMASLRMISMIYAKEKNHLFVRSYNTCCVVATRGAHQNEAQVGSTD